MRVGRILAVAMAGASLASAPVAAHAAPVEQTRAGAEIEGENLRGGWLIPLIVLVAVIAGILLVTGSDSQPHSP